MNQCAGLLQRKFRRWLHVTIFPTAQKIKGWYRTLKEKERYKIQLFIYRQVRQIQRHWRGILGRRVGAVVLDFFGGIRRIQRVARRARSLFPRAFGLSKVHQLYYESTIRIQHKFRWYLSKPRAHHKLLAVLLQEEERFNREQQIYKETLKVGGNRNRFYLASPAGKLHVADSLRQIRCRDEKFNKSSDSLPWDEILAHRAMVTFEAFDRDGSGLIGKEELSVMMKSLCIVISSTELDAVIERMDVDNSGDIDFS